jgi:uncharacterized membrane protein
MPDRTAEGGPGRTDRRTYLDWLRGIGVLIMIEAHTLDSWTQLSERNRSSYQWAIVLGGFGAPIFLFLAGVAMVLAINARTRRGMSAAEAGRRATRRGWEVFGLAFLFRLQSLLISGGGMRAYLKVDILNVMGVAMLVASWLLRRCRTTPARVAALVTAVVLVAMLTPTVRSFQWLDRLPDPLEAYLRPIPGRTTFTLFPWASFLFGGALVGIFLDRDRTKETRHNVMLLVAGLSVAAAGYATSYLPPLYAETSYWTSSPTFFFVRLGLIATLVPVAYAWSRTRLGRWGRSPLQEFGVASLFVYWIHVEMVYGVVSTPLHRALTFEQALFALALFSLFLFGLVRLKSRWASRRAGEKSTKFASYRVGPASNRPQSG